MVEFRHKLAVYFLLSLSPIIESKEPEAGYELVERHTEDQHIMRSDRLLMFGAIQMSTSAWRDKDCMLDIVVEIGDSTWKQQLNSRSFAFQVPVTSFGGMIGMISIHEHEGKGHRLWSHFFIVQDEKCEAGKLASKMRYLVKHQGLMRVLIRTNRKKMRNIYRLTAMSGTDLGVQRLHATLSGDCTRITNPGSSLISWIPAMCPFLSVMGKTGSLLLFTRPLTDVTLVCPACLSYGDNICIITGALERYSTTAYERRAYLRVMVFLKTLRLYIRDRLRITGDSSDWHLVFGVNFLQKWHFHCLGIVYLLLHTVIWFLRILESASTTALSKLEPPVAADDFPPCILDRKLQASCPSSDTSFSGLTRQGLMLSGSDFLFHDSWGADAHQYYYKCTARGTSQSRSFSDLLEQLDSDHSVNSERWSRDRNGRLIRHRL